MVRGAFPGGGSQGLADLLDRYGEAIEADLRACYGIDVLDFWRGRLTARQVFRYLRMLPDTSRLHAHWAADPQVASKAEPPPWRAFFGWGQDRYMTKALIDLLSAAHTAAKKKPWEYPGPAAPAEKALAGGTPFRLMLPPGRG